MRYQLIADGEEIWRLDDRAEILEYAAWLVEMPWHAPEMKANKTMVVDMQAAEVIYEGVRTDHRPKTDS